MADSMTSEESIRIGDVDARTLLYTELNRTGSDPSFLFELLENIVERRLWEVLLDDSGNPVGSLRRLIEEPLPTGCGQSINKILALLEIEHRYERNSDWGIRMKCLRENIQRELKIRRQRNRILRRLENERPDLADKISKGELSVNAAAVEAGLIRRRIMFYPDDLDNTVNTLRQNLDEKQLKLLVEKLTNIE